MSDWQGIAAADKSVIDLDQMLVQDDITNDLFVGDQETTVLMMKNIKKAS